MRRAQARPNEHRIWPAEKDRCPQHSRPRGTGARVWRCCVNEMEMVALCAYYDERNSARTFLTPINSSENLDHPRPHSLRLSIMFTVLQEAHRSQDAPLFASPRYRTSPFRITVSPSYSDIQRRNPSFSSHVDLSVQRLTYLHLRMSEMAVDYVRLNTDFELMGGYVSPVSNQNWKPGLMSAHHCESSIFLVVEPGLHLSPSRTRWPWCYCFAGHSYGRSSANFLHGTQMRVRRWRLL